MLQGVTGYYQVLLGVTMCFRRNTLFEKNSDLEEQLECISDKYRQFHKEMSEKNDKVCRIPHLTRNY